MLLPWQHSLLQSLCVTSEISPFARDRMSFVKVYMKQNQFFNIWKVQHFKDTILKFEPQLKKNGHFITPGNCAILLSKMVFESHSQNVPMTYSVVGKTRRLLQDTACIGYTKHQYPRCHLKIQRQHPIQNHSTCCFASETFLSDRFCPQHYVTR